MFSRKIFPDKEKIDNIILRNPSPFILQTTTKSSIPEIFVGRNEEIKVLTETIKRVVENNSCVAISIEGAGGSGKSTLYAHIYRSVKQKKYDAIDLDNSFKLDTAFIDAPEDVEYCNILYIYNQLMQDLGKSSFFDELAFYTMKKILEIIQTKYDGKNPLKKIKTVEDYLESTNLELFNDAIEQVKQYYRVLKIREDFRFDWQFLDKLFQVLNPDFEISMHAVGELDGSITGEDAYIKNKTDASNLLNVITDLIGWIYENKKVGIILGIDNIESLIGTNKEEKFINFYNMLLDFRNKVNRTLLVIIGTFTTWNEFTTYLKNTDYYNQFLGLFSSNNISLKFLELSQIHQIIKKHLELLYNENSLTLPVSYPLYPFSEESIEYLYRMSGRNIRKLKKKLNDLWTEFQTNKSVEYLSDAFEIMKKFKSNMLLDDFEIEILYNKLWSSEIKTSGKRSTLVEEGLRKAFESLRTETDFDIYQVENNPHLRIKDNSKIKTVRPDVVVTLTSKFKIGEMKKIEFQVKIYEENSSILRKHVNTSRKLLEQQKIDFVYFVTTGDFAKSLISELREKFPERIGGIASLNKTQQAYLSMITFYEEIFHNPITPSRAKILLENALGIKAAEFFDYIKQLPKISKLTDITMPLDYYQKLPQKTQEVKQEEFEIEIIEESPKQVEVNQKQSKKAYPEVIEDILLFMYRRTGRYEKQTTYTYLKGKITSFRDEEVKNGFNWLKKQQNYVDEISDVSIKINETGIYLLRNLNKI